MFINHFFKCVFCNKENEIKIQEDDRGSLQMKKGEEIPYTCIECHKKDKIHINKIKAEPNKKTLIGSMILSVISTILLFNFGFVATLSFGLPMIVYLYQQNSAKNFNSYKIKTK